MRRPKSLGAQFTKCFGVGHFKIEETMLSLFAFLRVAFLIIGIWAITPAIGRRYPRRSIARPRLDRRLTRVLRALAYVALLFLLVISVLLFRAFFGWPIWMQTMLDYPLAILIVALFVL